MALTFADTDVLIDFLERREPAKSWVLAAKADGSLVTTTVTRFELLAGSRDSDRRATAIEFLGGIRAYPLDPSSADRAAQVWRDLESVGQRIDPGDCLIAGIVLQHGGKLLTRNRRHFERVKDLSLT